MRPTTWVVAAEDPEIAAKIEQPTGLTTILPAHVVAVLRAALRHRDQPGRVLVAPACTDRRLWK
jgi:hypothetical protein